MRFINRLAARGLIVAAALLATPIFADEIRVMSSGGFYSAMEALAPLFENQTGHRIVLISGSSMGSSPTAIPARLQNGEGADLLMMAAPELDKLIEQGYAVPGSRVDLVHSKIGMVVRAGAPKPDIATAEAFAKTLHAAASIGYSASASGVHLAKNVLPLLGDAVVAKSREIVKDRVATWVARGDVEIGFQQVSELLPIPGVDFVGEIPPPFQKVTVFSVGQARNAHSITAARTLIRFLTSPEVYPVIEAQGLQPAALTEGKAH